MLKQLPVRQRLRKALVILAFLSFPITMNFLSPYVIIDGAMNGIVNGSLVMFGLMFLSSLFLGRAWCGWVCPGSGMAEIAEPVNSRPVNPSKIDWIKWLIWIPWITLIVVFAISAGGYKTIDLLYHTQNGISVAGTPDRPIFIAYIIYYAVISLFFGLAFFAGRRAGCHTICWMSPFMIIGRWLRTARPDRQRLAFMYQIIRQILSGRELFGLNSRVTFGEVLSNVDPQNVLKEIERSARYTLARHMGNSLEHQYRESLPKNELEIKTTPK